MDSLVQDLRWALVALRRRPLVASAIVLTLGVGIGANAAIFRAFDAAFLRPLPFAREDRLVRIYLSDPSRDANLAPRAGVFLEVRDRARSFSAVAGQRFNDFTAVIGGREPERIAGIEVSEGWAETLGVEPVVGRTFTPEEEQGGAASGVVLLSHAMWTTRFGGTPEALGSAMALDGRSFTVVGVLPPGLRFPYESEVWIPARFDLQREATWGLNIVARLRDGVTHEAMSAELRRLTPEIPEVAAQSGLTLRGVPIREVLIDDDAPLLVAVSVAVAFLLVLVTVNVANLLVAHALSRHREFAIRTALGAGLGRHLRQTLTEGLVLATLGAALGLLIAASAGTLLTFLVPEDFAYVLDSVPFDWRVIGFTAGIALLTGCVFGAIPALRVARGEPNAVLAGGERSGTARGETRAMTLLLVVQIALALVLLAAAGAMIRDFDRRAARDLGYDPDGLVTLNVVLPAERYSSAAERDAFFDALAGRLEAVPGVAAAGTVNLFPAAGQGSIISRIEGEGVAYDDGSPLLAHSRVIHGGLLDALAPRLLRGRLIAADEARRGDAVAVISRSLASALWSGADPIGRKIRASRTEDAPWLEVVGVIDDLAEFYGEHSRSIWQPVKLFTDQPFTGQIVVVARLSSGAEAAASIDALRGAIRESDPALAVFDVSTAEELYAGSLSGRRSARTLTTAFAAAGLLVAAVGIWAAMAFAMSRRAREIAVRAALGGTRARLVRHFLGRVLAIVAAGAAIGGATTLAAARVWGSALLGDPLPPGAIAAAAGILITVALLASWVPLHRAVRLDPARILRTE